MTGNIEGTDGLNSKKIRFLSHWIQVRDEVSPKKLRKTPNIIIFTFLHHPLDFSDTLLSVKSLCGQLSSAFWASLKFCSTYTIISVWYTEG